MKKELCIGLLIILIVIILFIYRQNNDINIDLSKYEKKIYSQNGEDGITIKLIETIYTNPNNKYYVEFGVESGSECNTRILREKYNWDGLLMDGSNENNSINLRKEFITRENIIYLFKKYKVPKYINLLCIDLDFNDHYILKKILPEYRTDIIICEYNSSHKPQENKVVKYDANYMWDGTNYFGASLLAFQKLLNKYNYSLVYCDKMGVNCFFIHNDIIRMYNLKFKNINNCKLLYNPPYGGGHIQDPKNRTYVSYN